MFFAHSNRSTPRRPRTWKFAGLAAVLLLLGAPAVSIAQETPPHQTDAQETAAPETGMQGGAEAAAPAEPERVWHHGLALQGEVKYPPDFKHFDYVNPDAPKGGTARLGAMGTFDSLNPFTFKGRPAGLVGQIYDTLMATSLDEPGSEYGLIAEAVSFPDDFSSVTYRLRPEARWHDGRPITPEDVVFSMNALKKGHPFYAGYYNDVIEAKQTGEREVTFIFRNAGNRELPQIVGQLAVLPKHWWMGKNAKGEPRDIHASTLEVPLGSGPYRIGEVKPGRSISVERVADYWGRDLPVNVGANNFATIELEYFRDDTVALEAFKGDQFDWRNEFSAKNWATAYDFPAARDGRVKLERFRLENGAGMQAFVFNMRRQKFKDPRVRRAFNHIFDFEWANRNLFFGQYVRTNSFFANSDLAASGTPGPREREILGQLKAPFPDEVLSTPYTNPVNGDRETRRENRRQAVRLLEEAGWTIKSEIRKDDPECGWWCRLLLAMGLRPPRRDLVLRDKNGTAMEVEFLLVSPAFERVVLPFTRNLEQLGIRSTVRTIDSSQYQNRLDSFDFDIIVGSWGQSLSPGNEQRDFWGSKAARTNGSRNYAGIENPAVDALIDRLILARDRDDLVAATRALDRVLLWNHYVVPQWHSPYERIAYWDRFAPPKRIPEHSIGFPSIWSWDQAKADAVAAGKR